MLAKPSRQPVRGGLDDLASLLLLVIGKKVVRPDDDLSQGCAVCITHDADILRLGLFIVSAVGVLSGVFFAVLHIADDTVPEAPRQNMPAAFNGDLLAVSDVDQVATAYGDGVLGRMPNTGDELSFISWEGGRPVLHRNGPGL